MRAVERSYPRPPSGRLFYRICLRGLPYRPKDASGASWDYGATLLGEHAAKRDCEYFSTASITESGLSFSSREGICPAKEIAAILCYLVPILE